MVPKHIWYAGAPWRRAEGWRDGLVPIADPHATTVSMAAVEDSLQGSSDKENHENPMIYLGFSIKINGFCGYCDLERVVCIFKPFPELGESFNII